MPELLAMANQTDNTVFHYKGILSPPKSFQDWRDFMTAFGSALIDRYGLEEVQQWYVGAPRGPLRRSVAPSLHAG